VDRFVEVPVLEGPDGYQQHAILGDVTPADIERSGGGAERQVRETYAAFRSVVSTAKANRASVLDTVRFVISAKRPGDTLAGAG